MKRLITLVVGIACACSAMAADAELLSIRKIWDAAPHNAFTDLTRWNNRWWCVFREGAAHVSPDGALRVLVSDDGVRWTSAARITDSLGDLRDAKITITPDNRLMLSGAAAIPQPNVLKHQSLAWFSGDGLRWSDAAKIGETNLWLWRTTWHQGTAYGVGYTTDTNRFVRLYRSKDGRQFDVLVPQLFSKGYPNEATLLFQSDDTALCLLRRDGTEASAQLGTSRPPYTQWDWKDLGVKIGGPNFLRLPDGRLVAGVRLYDTKHRTSLAWLDAGSGKLTEFLTLPSAGDSSYPSLVWHENTLWVSYYSSHEGKSSIYLAQVKIAPSAVTENTDDDPYLWLEEVSGDRALAWVREQNAVSTNELERAPGFREIRERTLAILNSRERIPYVGKHGPYVYNFWRDARNVRGLWRRTTLEDYKNVNPNWETVLDLDQLATTESENWVWKSANVIEPGHHLALVSLSRGGADATVVREFDLKAKQFVTNGFFLPEAKSRVDWRDENTLYVGTDFGAGSLTKSGYPRVVKEWKRGTPLSAARTVFEGDINDVSVHGFSILDHGRTYDFIDRSPTFFTDEIHVRQGEQWLRIDKPNDAQLYTFGDWLLLKLRTDWQAGGKSYPGGSLLAANFDAFLAGDRNLTPLFTPTERTSLSSVSDTKNFLILTELDNVRSRPFLLKPSRTGPWERTALEAPAFGTVSVSGIDANESDEYFMTVEDYLTPSTLYYGMAGTNRREKLKSLPAFFNVSGLEIQQFEARSKDGTRVPYFQVSPKGMKLDGSHPTLLYGYGGFEISMLPGYNPAVGAGWLERGGVFVVANIRGGGEFGPRWHAAARKENRQRAYDDFIAVGEDLVRRKVTSPKHLGIQGGSNGGLLVGAMLTQRPELWGAVVCQVPLLDMRRFNKLLAGASWMDEYGDPDRAEEWAYIQKYSPYQNVKKDVRYPRVFFTTSTRDDRVHPGHARKMVARMKELGHDVIYYENIEGGHGGAANNEQAAYMRALAYAFLWKELK